MQIREGLHYNPYFPGGAIAMPKMLNDGAVEYEDGTPATEAQVANLFVQNGLINLTNWFWTLERKNSAFSNVLLQMGKDVVSFLSWAAEPEMEERKLVCSFNIMFPPDQQRP